MNFLLILKNTLKSKAHIIIILIGVFLRLRQFFFNRSIWGDEAFLCVNILEKNFNDLAGALDYIQMAPVLFLYIEKIAINLFGVNEYTFRLFPLIVSILSLFLFYKFFKNIVSNTTLLLGLTLFAFSVKLIGYSAFVKQYSFDIFSSLICFNLLLRTNFLNKKTFYFFINGIVGAILVWLSNPIIFILFVIGSWYLYLSLKEKKYDLFFNICLMISFWIVSFGIEYFLFLKDNPSRKIMEEFWSFAFMPIFPKTIEDIKWFSTTFESIVYQFTASKKNGLIAILLITGIIAIIKEKKVKIGLILLPILIVLFLSAFKLYPFRARLLLFIYPSFVILLALGINKLTNVNFKKPIILVIVSLLLIDSGLKLRSRNEVDDIRLSLEVIKKNIKENDIVYVYYGAIPGFKLYQDKFLLKDTKVIIGNNKLDLNNIDEKVRCWVLFSYIYQKSDVKKILSQLNKRGECLKSFSQGSEVYLYKLK